MYDILKAITEGLGWVFVYARRDFQNLYDDVSNDLIPHLFLDPVKIDEKFDDTNVLQKTNYSGYFMLTLSSDLDEESYEYRYENYIKPLKEDVLKRIKDDIDCNYEVTFVNWSFTEVINMLDQNLDGLLVSYSVEIEA